MTYAEHKCRDCGHVERRMTMPVGEDCTLLRASDYSLCRHVKCPMCGGIMDPTPKGIEEIDKARGID